ncbi:MAG: hypothetical protein Q9162_002212 [Coniocarpon cinnabarinum]
MPDLRQQYNARRRLRRLWTFIGAGKGPETDSDALQLAPDDPYLSFTKADYDGIKGDWLTDNVISFWEEYLEHEKILAIPNAHIVLLRPSMSFMLMLSSDVADIKDALPDFSGITHIFLPINDCTSADLPEGGSHWSLLLVSVLDNIAFHYDSLYPANKHAAEHCFNHFQKLLNKPMRFVNLKDSPQQANGSDCGVYVCVEMKELLKRLLKRDSREQISMSMRGLDVDAERARAMMVKLVDEFRKEGKSRSRSRNRSPSTGGGSKSPPRVGPDVGF